MVPRTKGSCSPEALIVLTEFREVWDLSWGDDVWANVRRARLVVLVLVVHPRILCYSGVKWWLGSCKRRRRCTVQVGMVCMRWSFRVSCRGSRCHRRMLWLL